MVLTIHAVKGTAIGLLLPPGIGQVASFLSHFAADRIPHWELDQAVSQKWPKRIIAGVDLGGAFFIYGVLMAHFTPIIWSLHVFSCGFLACLPDAVKLVKQRWFMSTRFARLTAFCHKQAHIWQDRRQKYQTGFLKWQVAAIAAILIFFI